jgi:hypothetical protein
MRDWLMFCLLRLLPVLAIRLLRSRRELLLENLALRQQLTVLKRRHPQFAISDKLFWVMLRRLWYGWKCALVLVRPETVAPHSNHSGTSLNPMRRLCCHLQRSPKGVQSLVHA